jgi:DmsE family decaheme c-type cytochrome
MGRWKRTLGPAVPIAGALALWVVAVATVPAETTPAAATVTSGAQASAQANGYVGEETCLTCHEDKKAINGTPHGMSGDAKTPAATHGCESCHGPGQAHVDGGGDKTKIRRFETLTPSEASAVCTTCHNRGDHLMWDSSAHESRGVACTTCHSVHSFKSAQAQLKKATISETCATCHRDKVMKTRRSAHMPVSNDPNRPASHMECTTCHNPHGSANEKMLRTGTSVNDLCTSCHTEKRGPYLWEHAAVVDSCTNCHDPHGSSFQRMLVTQEPMLCQRCHVTTRHPPTVYDNYVRQNSTGANRIVGRSCVVCHQNIHGSNAASGEFFLR